MWLRCKRAKTAYFPSGALKALTFPPKYWDGAGKCAVPGMNSDISI